jgi:exosome complex component RRP43
MQAQLGSYQKLFPAEFFESFVAKGLRPDGRQLDESRTLTVQTGVVRTARSSSSVQVGHSYAIAGVNLQLAQPGTDKPDQGLAAVKV